MSVTGSVLVTECAVEAMKKNRGGATVDPGSTAWWVTLPKFSDYNGTKAVPQQLARNTVMCPVVFT